MLTGPWEFEQPWVAISIGLYVALAATAFGLYSPTLSRQIRVYEAEGPDAPEFAALGRRGRLLGALLGLLVLAIIVLMVVKPGA